MCIIMEPTSERIKEKVGENMRGLLYNRIGKPIVNTPTDARIMEVAAKRVAQLDAKKGLSMDPTIVSQIGEEHDKVARLYAEEYTKRRPKYSGKRKQRKVRKTRRVKKVNGR
jgi:hypothetical protein